MRHSCGAILYSYDTKGNLGIILGMEGTHWLPFKGGRDVGETLEDAAIREIYEETCKLVKIDTIKLEHSFSSKHKHYHIGLCNVPYEVIDKFESARENAVDKKYTEKTCIKFFPFLTLKKNSDLHSLTRASIKFYWNKLLALSFKKTLVNRTGERLRKLGKHVIPGEEQSKTQKISNRRFKRTNGKAGAVYKHNESFIHFNVRQKYKRTFKKTSFLKQPIKYGLNYTPQHEMERERNRVWRRSSAV